MNEQNETLSAAHQLMELHVEALFTYDERLRLHTINEPWPGSGPAPRFFLGRTIAGPSLCRIRHDVDDHLAEQLELWSAEESMGMDVERKPRHFENYRQLLQGQRFTMGPCFLVREGVSPAADAVIVTRDNAELLRGGFEWLLSEIDYAQPCAAIVRDNRAVSVCRSVRITSRAHEAGLETLEAYRGRGLASEAVAGWAKAVRNKGCLPLYSTSWENRSSRRVASKLSLALYGAHFSIV
ncbi:GNAT family N-acetyltransferase [Paenibacillus doosanensis]|uniref:GNAT family N-acetyltransferase n=1 Tax=Paenibacillus doosanensis TaxID=1229154 RepID=UPI00217FBE9D|nr:GNAT family N-acetyltransferase [Paenibacillus doosanensis]MCS7461549.1 GNAT family N-acetyltransferase [Paenibacillus doosanensis]